MSDLISRQAAIEALDFKTVHMTGVFNDEKNITNPFAQYNKGLEDGIKAIRDLPSAEPEQKWIPVTEALPKNAEFVLLTIRRLDKSYNQTPFISVGYISWNQSAWWCAHDGDCDSHNVEVLAWMPLPESYKGD